MDYPRLTTDCVWLTVRMNGRKKSFWAKPVKSLKAAKPGVRSFFKVNNQGEFRYTYDQKTNVETKHVELFIVATSDIVEEKSAVYSCKYAELEVA
jgi:hypothetical protein